jgi:hypothetical protein
MVEALLTARSDHEDLFDLNTLVALLVSSEIPELASVSPKSPSPPPEATTKSDDQFTMDSLVESFLSQTFTAGTPRLPESRTRVLETKEVDLGLKSCLPNGYLSRPARELFCHYTKKYFHLYNGVKLVFDECEASMTGLGAFRKDMLREKLLDLDMAAEKAKNK